MELKDILAIRLRALMDQRPDLDTQMKIHKKTGLSQSTIQRILARQVHTGLDVLQALADAYRVNPLDLLKEIDGDDLDQTISPDYDESTLILAWRRLSDEDKHRAMAFIQVSGDTKVNATRSTKTINIASEGAVPAHLSAAVKRASSVGPDSKTGIDPEVKHEERKTAAGKRKSGSSR